MLYIEPQAGVQPILTVIQDARSQLDLNVYYLSSKRILEALQDARTRGVAVRVILDEKPYGMRPAQVRREARALQDIPRDPIWQMVGIARGGPPKDGSERMDEWVYDRG